MKKISKYREGVLRANKDINCLRDWLKLFFVYFSLSLSDVSFEAKSVGFQTSPVDNI